MHHHIPLSFTKPPAEAQTDERWKPVPGWEDLYEVSDYGRVRSLRTGRMLKPWKRNGYDRIELRNKPIRSAESVHRLVLEAFVGPCPPGMEACHSDDNATNNRLENLRWATRHDNAQDRLRNSRYPNAQKTHCPRGHTLSIPNLVEAELKNGKRSCLACSRAQSRVFYWKHESPMLHTIADQYYARIMENA